MNKNYILTHCSVVSSCKMVSSSCYVGDGNLLAGEGNTKQPGFLDLSLFILSPSIHSEKNNKYKVTSVFIL